ncbi:MAG: hypothetical protein ACT4TC_01550 [Myxococcaceae bacterium]
MHATLLSLFLLGAAPDAGSATAPAAKVETPTAAELKKVITYYYQGKDQGPILVELKPCQKMESARTGATKSECLETVSGPVKKGTVINAWTLWMVPDGGKYDDVFLQFVHEGQVRSTVDIKLDAAFRSRVWRPSALQKAGKWELKALRGTTELASVSVTVVD